MSDSESRLITDPAKLRVLNRINAGIRRALDLDDAIKAQRAAQPPTPGTTLWLRHYAGQALPVEEAEAEKGGQAA